MSRSDAGQLGLLEVARRDQAEYAYMHPFAYAAAQGISERDVLQAAGRSRPSQSRP